MAERYGRARRVAAVVLGAVVAVAACSSGDGTSAPGGTGSTPGGEREGSALEKLGGGQLCDLLPAQAIERELGVPVRESEGKERGRAPSMEPPYFLSRECEYRTGGLGLSTRVASAWDERSSDEEVLDGVFTDPTKEPKAVGDYERVPGLGAVAGYGADATLAGADVAGRYLAVVFRVGEERMALTVHALGKAELAQLRPLAEKLLTGLEKALA